MCWGVVMEVAVIAGMFWPCMPQLPVGAKENDSVMLESHDCILACKKGGDLNEKILISDSMHSTCKHRIGL